MDDDEIPASSAKRMRDRELMAQELHSEHAGFLDAREKLIADGKACYMTLYVRLLFPFSNVQSEKNNRFHVQIFTENKTHRPHVLPARG